MEHTYVICAYQKSPFLEECILSLKNQTVSSIILLATATPDPYLEELCSRYQIEYCVRDGQPGIDADWNYALSLAKTPYVTNAHQDDVYEPDYTEQIMRYAKAAAKGDKSRIPLILFCNYSELIHGKKEQDRKNLGIKRRLLEPLKKTERQGSVFWKRHVIRFGNAICCPSVTYHMETILMYMKADQKEKLFEEHFRSNLDWETWEWLSKKEGSFVFIPKYMLAHRIHEGSETSATIREHQRGKEDYQMFCKFWPGWIAKVLTAFYGQSEKDNSVGKEEK